MQRGRRRTIGLRGGHHLDDDLDGDCEVDLGDHLDGHESVKKVGKYFDLKFNALIVILALSRKTTTTDNRTYLINEHLWKRCEESGSWLVS